ncbi:MAG: ubiquitin-like domain-containing protein [Clostridium sp.]|nr:ubiquitin-like domain-containing protein [Clostridium sp.]
MLQKLKGNIRTYFSSGPKVAFFITVLVFVCGAVGLLNMEKSVNIMVDGQEMSVMTYRSSVEDILKKNNIALGPKDIVEPDLKSKIKSGDTIKIEKAVNVQLEIDGQTKTVLTNADSVDQMLAEERIQLGEEDKILPAKGEKIKEGLKIAITRMNTKVEKKIEPIEFATEVKKDPDLKEGHKKVVQEGTTGQKEVNIKVVYKDGKEISREVVNEKVVKKPTNKVVAMGTLKTMKLSRGGEINYSKKYRMRATAYTESYKDTGKRPGDKGFGITASGTRVRRNPEGYSTVAVDPRIIPLGTKLYIPGYGYAIAEDTGGAIKGNKIDLYFNGDNHVYRWGVKYVDVYIVD